MNRFSLKKSSSHLLRQVLISAIFFCCIVFALLLGTSKLQATSEKSQIDSLRQAILRSAVHCYATEGTYPESLDYICDHYGIRWDTDKYIVDYEITGSNLMPDINIFPLHQKEEAK